MVVRRPARHSLPSPPESADTTGRITVPKLVQAPIASLQPCPVIISVGSTDYTIPAMSAADWLTVLLDDDLDLEQIFPGFVPDANEAVDDALLNGDLTMEELYNLSLDAIEVASGRRWYVVLRLMGVAKQNWDVIGAELALRGVDGARLSLAAWLDAFLLIVLRAMDPKKITMFTLKLEAPLESEAGPEQGPEMSADDFMSMA